VAKNGRALTIASDTSVKTWDINQREKIRDLVYRGAKSGDIDAAGSVLISNNTHTKFFGDGKPEFEVEGISGVFLPDGSIAVIGSGGKSVRILDRNGEGGREFPTNRTYPLTSMAVQHEHLVLTYSDDVIELRTVTDFSLVASGRGKAGAVGGGVFATVLPEGISVRNLNVDAPPKMIPWTSAKAVTVNKAGTSLLIIDREKMTAVDLEGKVQFQHAFFRDYSSATITGRMFSGSIFHILFESNGKSEPYGDAYRDLLNSEKVARVIRNTL
jgi:hypothetical protein